MRNEIEASKQRRNLCVLWHIRKREKDKEKGRVDRQVSIKREHRTKEHR
jgi:hypothetical protein